MVPTLDGSKVGKHWFQCLGIAPPSNAERGANTFPTQNVPSTPFSDHFWKLRCRRSARRCGAKHISKSKCSKHTIFRPLLEVDISKQRTPSWRETHFQVKMLKAQGVRTTFGRSDVVSCGRRKGLCTLSKVSKTWNFCGFWGSFSYNQHYTTLHYTTLRCTTLHYTPFHSTPLHPATTTTTTKTQLQVQLQVQLQSQLQLLRR